MIIRQHKLAYFAVPKVVCTSVKSFLYEIKHGVAPSIHVAEGKIENIHHAVPSVAFNKQSLDMMVDMPDLPSFAALWQELHPATRTRC
ncbi:MAG: hypothetical protein COB16_12840 [Rhodobacteraceae bacterium]|nr:MAG: hypothetical protein COB16_12840 [Paracoccaceae bacterium]